MRKKCHKKYEFVNYKVFVEFFLKKRLAKIEAKLNQEVKGHLELLIKTGDLREKFKREFADPLQLKFAKEFQALMASAAVHLEKAITLKNWKEDDLFKASVQQLDALMALARGIEAKVVEFDKGMILFGNTVSEKHKYAYRILQIDLVSKFVNDALDLLKPLAEDLMKGLRVKKTRWPELEALKADYDKVITPAAKK